MSQMTNYQSPNVLWARRRSDTTSVSRGEEEEWLYSLDTDVFTEEAEAAASPCGSRRRLEDKSTYIICGSCLIHTRLDCAQTVLLQSPLYPRCPACQCYWISFWIHINFPKSFLKGAYKRAFNSAATRITNRRLGLYNFCQDTEATENVKPRIIDSTTSHVQRLVSELSVVESRITPEKLGYYYLVDLPKDIANLTSLLGVNNRLLTHCSTQLTIAHMKTNVPVSIQRRNKAKDRLYGFSSSMYQPLTFYVHVQNSHIVVTNSRRIPALVYKCPVEECRGYITCSIGKCLTCVRRQRRSHRKPTSRELEGSPTVPQFHIRPCPVCDEDMVISAGDDQPMCTSCQTELVCDSRTGSIDPNPNPEVGIVEDPLGSVRLFTLQHVNTPKWDQCLFTSIPEKLRMLGIFSTLTTVVKRYLASITATYNQWHLAVCVKDGTPFISASTEVILGDVFTRTCTYRWDTLPVNRMECFINYLNGSMCAATFRKKSIMYAHEDMHEIDTRYFLSAVVRSLRVLDYLSTRIAKPMKLRLPISKHNDTALCFRSNSYEFDLNDGESVEDYLVRLIRLFAMELYNYQTQAFWDLQLIPSSQNLFRYLLDSCMLSTVGIVSTATSVESYHARLIRLI